MLPELRLLPVSDTIIIDLDDQIIEFVKIEREFPTLCSVVPSVGRHLSQCQKSFDSLHAQPHPTDKSPLANLRVELHAHYNHGKSKADRWIRVFV